MSRENSRDCDLVQDLLPLYLDDACSASSKKVVEEHLAECVACREVVQKLKDHTVEDVIAAESESVLRITQKGRGQLLLRRESSLRDF